MNLKLWHLGVFAATIIGIVMILMPDSKEKGVLLARSGKVEEAERKLLPIISKDPENIKVIDEMAKGYVKGGEHEKSNELYEDYLKKNPHDQEVILKLVKDYVANFKYQEAFDLLEKNKTQNYDQLIDLAVKMGELDKAVAYSKEELTQLDDKKERVKLLKEIEKYQQWQLNYSGVGEAREELAKEKDTLQNNLDALDFFVWKKKKKKMKYYAGKVGAFKDLPIDTERKLRSVWITLRDAKKAVAAAERVVAMAEAEYTDWVDYVTLLGWTGQNAKALAVIEKLIAKYPAEQDLYIQGLAFAAKLNNRAKRAEILQQYYAYSKDIDLLREAADIYLALGNEQKAIALFDKIFDSTDTETLKNLSVQDKIKLAELYRKAGKKGGKVLLDSAFRSLLGNDMSGLTADDFWVGIEYAKKSKNKRLEAEVLRKFYSFDGDVQMLRDARDLFVEINDIDDAVRINETLMSKYELSELEEFGLVRQYAKLGENEKARVLAEKLYKKLLSGEIEEEDPYWVALDYATETKDNLMKAKLLDKFYEVNKDPALLRDAIVIYKAAGEKRAAVADYERLLADNSMESFDKEELLTLYQELGEEEKLQTLALQFYKEAMGNTRLDKVGDLYYTLLTILPEVGYESASIKLIKKYAEKGDIEARIQLAQYYRDSEKLAEALAELEEIVNDPSVEKDYRDQAAVQLAFIYTEEFYQEGAEQLEVFAKGGKYITQAISILVNSMDSAAEGEIAGIQESIDTFNLVELRMALLEKKFEKADSILAKLYKPDSAVYLGIASAYYDSDNEKKARVYLDKVTDTADFGINEFSLLGYMYSSFEEYDKALAAYTKAEKLSRGLDKDVMLGLAQVYGRTGQIEKQYNLVDFYTSFAETTVDDWLAAANARAEHSNSKGEFIILTKAVEAHSKSPLLLARLISRLVGYGERERAVALAKRLRGLKVKKDFEELLTVGYALLDVGQIREAGRMFLASREVDNTNPEVKLALARYYTAVYLYPQAQKVYMQYLKKNKEDAGVWYELAVLKRAAGFSGGRYAFLKAQSLLNKKEKTAADFSLASSISFYLNKRDAALRSGRYANILSPESTEYQLDMAELYNSFGYPEHALQSTASVKGDSNVAARRDNLKAEAYLLTRRFKEGVKSLKNVIMGRPDDSAAQEASAYAQLELGEWVEAADSLALAEIKSNQEEERLAANYQQRAALAELKNAELPDLEDE